MGKKLSVWLSVRLSGCRGKGEGFAGIVFFVSEGEGGRRCDGWRGQVDLINGSVEGRQAGRRAM